MERHETMINFSRKEWIKHKTHPQRTWSTSGALNFMNTSGSNLDSRSSCMTSARLGCATSSLTALWRVLKDSGPNDCVESSKASRVSWSAPFPTPNANA